MLEERKAIPRRIYIVLCTRVKDTVEKSAKEEKASAS